MAMIIIAYYIKKIELPYALSWWAFTFPTGALSVASGIAWKVTGFSIVYLFYIGSIIVLMLFWGTVFMRTIKGITSGKVFQPTH